MNKGGKAKIFDIGSLIEMTSQRISDRLVSEIIIDGRYAPDLLYRGIYIDDKLIHKVAEQGTDRFASSMEQEISRIMEQAIEDGISFTKEDYDMFTNPRLIWALPEAGLTKVINKYALPEFPYEQGKSSAVLVYNKDSFLPQMEELRKRMSIFNPLNEETALYMLKEGKKMNEALVAILKFKVDFDTFMEP